jgi:para-nitrobenzyl esterase
VVQAAPAAPTVSVAQGTLVGAEEGAVASFKGIPYAAPPVGDLRWRAPQPVAGWTGPRDATQYGHDCAQAPFPPDAAPIRTQPAEDCLYLNVWKPAGAAANARLPVMVWIHGGGFVNGGTSPAVYSGAAFARDGVVLVSLNYRLGRFGFFAHPALKAEGLGGNFGFLDQIAALKWVQANVAAFGGDPANVTVFGESAGGMSMHMLLQSPLARGLFARAIIVRRRARWHHADADHGPRGQDRRHVCARPRRGRAARPAGRQGHRQSQHDDHGPAGLFRADGRWANRAGRGQ